MQRKTRSWLWPLLVLAACGPPPPHDPLRVPGVAGPAPTVAWADDAIEITRMPAIAADASKVLMPELIDGGGFRLLVLGRNDVELDEQVVAGAAGAPSQVALDAARVFLERTNVQDRWQPLGADGVELTLAPAGQLTVKHRGVTVAERELTDCDPPVALEHAWVDVARQLVVVEVAYQPGAGCAVANRYHVVAWEQARQ